MCVRGNVAKEGRRKTNRRTDLKTLLAVSAFLLVYIANTAIADIDLLG
jgi:hypothetical protein